MPAGTSYAKRYAGGFFDKPTLTTPIDSTFLNAVEAALLQLIGSAPTADGQIAQWDQANTRFGPALLLNKNVDAAAAIAKSKLDFTGANGIVNADVAGGAAISRSKLDFGSGLVNSDLSASAAVAISKLAPIFGAPATTLPGSPFDGQCAILTDSTTAPTYQWLMVFINSLSKWMCVGGIPAQVNATGSVANTVDAAFESRSGPTFTAPRAGTYYIRLGLNATAVGTNSAVGGVGINGSTTVNSLFADLVVVQTAVGNPAGGMVAIEGPVSGINASGVLTLILKSANHLNTTFAARYMSIMPVLVT
jgi:hypothetical protein